MFRYVDWFDIGFGTFFLAVGLLFAAFIYDGIYLNVKNERKTVACKMRQMDYERYSFTDSVVCVPYPMRRDTIYVQGDANAVR